MIQTKKKFIPIAEVKKMIDEMQNKIRIHSDNRGDLDVFKSKLDAWAKEKNAKSKWDWQLDRREQISF